MCFNYVLKAANAIKSGLPTANLNHLSNHLLKRVQFFVSPKEKKQQQRTYKRAGLKRLRIRNEF